MISKQTKQAIIDIAKCKEIGNGVSDTNHSCNSLLNGQVDDSGNQSLGNMFHLPEPFNGDIETANILFIAANPNYDSNELYPKDNWLDDDIINFFVNRKINKSTLYWREILEISKYIYEQKYKSMATKEIVSRINKLLEDKNLFATLSDLHITLTEVVHCKSHSFSIVSTSACNKCVSNHLNNVLSLFKGKYIIIIGKDAQRFDSTIKQLLSKNVEVIFAPYYTSYCPNWSSLKVHLDPQL